MRLWTAQPKHLDARGLVTPRKAAAKLGEIKQIPHPGAHPLFDIVDGSVETWEKIAGVVRILKCSEMKSFR